MRAAYPKRTVYCVLSPVAMRCTDDGYILDTSLSTFLFARKPSQPRRRRICSDSTAHAENPSTRLSAACNRNLGAGKPVGVEFLLIDTDERVRVTQFLKEYLPLELEFHDSQSELTITAAD